MSFRLDILHFKKMIILFWTVWWIIAFWTDLTGLFAHHGLLQVKWAPDLNYPFLSESLKIYSTPDFLIYIFFIGIILWSFISAAAFVWASMALTKRESVWISRATIAFIISLTFWLAFYLADQLVYKFDLEENHMVQGSFELLCFLAIYLLPSKRKGNKQ